MLCKSCHIMFAFYFKYCRHCGRKLSEQCGPDGTETAMLASGARAEVGLMSAASAYATAPITMKMGTPGLSTVEMVQLVLKSYPSMKTERIRISGAQPMREFSMAEFTLVEKTAELVDREAVDRSLESRSAGSTVTLELPIRCVAATVP